MVEKTTLWLKKTSLWLKKVISFISGTSIITLDKLMGSQNYLSCVDYVKLWFIGNGCKDHLTNADTSIIKDKHSHWRKTDALLYNMLRQSIDTKTLYNVRAYKTCYTL